METITKEIGKGGSSVDQDNIAKKIIALMWETSKMVFTTEMEEWNTPTEMSMRENSSSIKNMVRESTTMRMETIMMDSGN